MPVIRLIIAAILAMLAAGCSLPRHFEAAVALADLMGAQNAAEKNGSAVSRIAIDYEVAGRRHQADLYLPHKVPPEAGIVLVPGVVPEGKDDPQLVALAAILTRARFAVIVPQMPGFSRLAVSADNAQDVADAFAYLADYPDLVPRGRVGIVAFSYAVGPAVLAALMPSIRDRVRFIFSVGGYYHFPRVIRYLTTGWFEHEAQWHWIKPNDYGKLVLVNAAKPYLSDERDRETIDAIAKRRLDDRTADIADLVGKLGPDGKAVIALATNADPARFPELYALLPYGMRVEIARLSLHNKDLTQMRARLLLMHGMNDSLIPWSESADLASAASDGKSRLFLIKRMLGHVNLGFSHVLSWQFVGEELPDIFRMWSAVDALFAEREIDEQ